MAYDEQLDARISDIVASWDATRKKMFGGTCYLLNGNMLGGVIDDRLIARIGSEAGAAALSEPSVLPFDYTGKPMRGWVTVGPDALEGDGLLDWLVRARTFVDTLPPK